MQQGDGEWVSSSHGELPSSVPTCLSGTCTGIVGHCGGASTATRPPETKTARLQHMDTSGPGKRPPRQRPFEVPSTGGGGLKVAG